MVARYGRPHGVAPTLACAGYWYVGTCLHTNTPCAPAYALRAYSLAPLLVPQSFLIKNAALPLCLNDIELVIIAIEFDFRDGDTFIIDVNTLGFHVVPLLRRDCERA